MLEFGQYQFRNAARCKSGGERTKPILIRLWYIFPIASDVRRGIDRHMEPIFLDHDRPLLHLAADYLIDRFYQNGRLDMRNVMLTLPEKRAINRLEEILAEHAERIDPAWYPPDFLTIGMLPEKLYELKYELVDQFADDLTQYFAWIHAIDQLDDEHPDLLRRLIPSPPSRDDMESRLALGRMIAKLHRELAAGTLDFTHVAEICRELKIETEVSRWEALDKLQTKYHAKLDSLRIWDVQSARLFALKTPEEFEPKRQQFQQDGKEIILVGVVDMNLAQKELLRHFGNFVTPLVFAPRDWSDRFDDLGCLIPHVWQNVPIDLHDQQIHIVESTGDQAEEVVRCLNNLKGKYAPPEIVIGVPDKKVVPFIERQFERVNIKTRIVAGTSIRQTSVYRFLETLLLYLESPTFAHFAALVRHPDVEAFLQSKLPQPIISELDRHHTDFLPVGLESLEKSETLNAVRKQLQELLAEQKVGCRPLGGNVGDSRHEVGQTLFDENSSAEYRTQPPGGRLPTFVFQQIFPEHKRDEAYHQILNTFSQIQEVPKELLSKPLTFVDTVRLVLAQVGSASIPMPHEPNAVELIGWLDLAMDDAEVVIVTGMNDGSVPSFQTSDMFLPDTMRQQLSKKHKLSIDDNSRRYARDAYALTCLLATRHYDPLRIQLIGSRRSAENDPMLTSRLFFAADDETVTKRVKRFFTEHREPPETITFLPAKSTAQRATKSAVEVAFAVPELPEHAGEEIKVMSVTEFKEYKACPYRYYLKYRYKLRTLNDDDDELDAKSFGNVIHKVLEWFGQDEKRKLSTSSGKIRDFLVLNFRELIRKQYGEQPRPVIAIQAERAVKRLEAFADWQAIWATKHEILATELNFDEERFSLDVGEKAMGLRGRIDRIDWNRETKELIILDYKTGSAHPGKHMSKGEWIDFQLPLYYHLLGQHAEYADALQKGFRLGYIVLPSDVSKTGNVFADWDRPMVLSAIEEARNVVRDIWSNRFDKVSPPPKYSEAFAAICNDF